MGKRKQGSERFTALASAAAITWLAAVGVFLATPADAFGCIEDCEGCIQCSICGVTPSGTTCYRELDP